MKGIEVKFNVHCRRRGGRRVLPFFDRRDGGVRQNGIPSDGCDRIYRTSRRDPNL